MLKSPRLYKRSIAVGEGEVQGEVLTQQEHIPEVLWHPVPTQLPQSTGYMNPLFPGEIHIHP